jgi:hypothetical protein
MALRRVAKKLSVKKPEKTGAGQGCFWEKPGISCDYVRLLIY